MLSSIVRRPTSWREECPIM